MKLSDTQLLILSSSQRNDHAAVLPANLKGSAAKKVVDKLLNERLLQELRTKNDMPIWRRGDDSVAATCGLRKSDVTESRRVNSFWHPYARARLLDSKSRI
jgi:hypothetical protein